jgi:hypothetical protein
MEQIQLGMVVLPGVVGKELGVLNCGLGQFHPQLLARVQQAPAENRDKAARAKGTFSQ